MAGADASDPEARDDVDEPHPLAAMAKTTDPSTSSATGRFRCDGKIRMVTPKVDLQLRPYRGSRAGRGVPDSRGESCPPVPLLGGVALPGWTW